MVHKRLPAAVATQTHTTMLQEPLQAQVVTEPVKEGAGPPAYEEPIRQEPVDECPCFQTLCCENVESHVGVGGRGLTARVP